MSFFFSLPPDGRPPPHRDDDLLAISKQTSLRSPKGIHADGTTVPVESLAHHISADPARAAALPRKNIVFPDPVAFRFLENDPCVTVVERRGTLRGYELYLVEQWACSRQSPTLVIVTYTGDEKHSVVVGVLSIPADEALWSRKLHVYFKATRQFLARSKDTQLGELMVTNLSNFPSALTVIPVPDGDIRKHRQVFIMNENLKRLGCSGRSGLTLSHPSEGTQAKFLNLYKICDKIPLFMAVTELVKLCQVALYLFTKLEHEYIDGLLCDVTEKAIGNWWTEVGAEHYNFEPSDGILGPATVAALLGMLMGARNRLYWYGAPVAKDVFDIECTKRGISYFQKAYKLEKTRRLDRQTLLKLHIVTAKAAAGGEGWGVQKAVKSRMTEIGGKRGEIVMGMVSGKDKGGLADIETLDLERFIAFASGERAKWLWYGKPRRMATDPDRNADGGSTSFGKDNDSNVAMHRSQTFTIEDNLEKKRKEELAAVYSDIPPGSATSITDGLGDKDALRRNVLKSVAGKMSDARSGFGRIKDAVGGGRRGHAARPSLMTREEGSEYKNGHLGLPGAADNAAIVSSPAMIPRGRAFTWTKKPEEYIGGVKRCDVPESLLVLPNEYRDPSSSASDSKSGKKLIEDLTNIGTEVRKDMIPPSAAESVVDEQDLQGPLLYTERMEGSPRLELARRHSLDVAQLELKHVFNEDRWPRRMSFSDAEEAIFFWDEIVNFEDPAESLEEVEALAEVARHLNRSIDDLTLNVEPWVEEKLKAVALLDERFARDKDDLQALYHQLNDACERVRCSSSELLAEERSSLTENVKEIDGLLQRLEYEINALVAKVVDVEDGIQNFERQVEDVEKRAAELKASLETESWMHWLVRTLTGVGTGANITRARQ